MRAKLIAIMFVSLPLLTACGRPEVIGTIIPDPNLYYEEVKGFVAALEYSTEHAPSEIPTITEQIQMVLANIIEEDITGHEDKFARMTVLADELDQLYRDDAGADETTPKLTELVAIANSLPGKEMAYDSYYEFPESDGE